MTAPASPFEQRQLRDVLGTFVTGVTVITTRDGSGVAHGVTANSFSSVSLDPPLVLWSQALTSKSYPAFQDSDHFTVNILADNQVAISNHFAKSREDKFSGIAHSVNERGAPIIDGVAAHLECVKVAAHPSGDHIVYIGRVERIGQSSRLPLAFGSGKYMVASSHDLGPASLRLGSTRPANLEAIRIAGEALPRIASDVGEHTVGLAVWGNHGPTIVQWAASSEPVSDQLRTGLVVSITRSATGHAFAAWLPSEMTKPFVDEDLRINPVGDEDVAARRARFDAEMAECRDKGIARVVWSTPSPVHQVAVNAFSAPIFDAAGNMIMALSLTSPATRLSPDWEGKVPQTLAAAAREISSRLGQAEKVPMPNPSSALIA